MALSNQQLQDRIEAIEAAINDMQTALTNIATKQQMKSILNVRQSEIVDLQTRVTSLESQIKVLQEAYGV
jgi:predicted nuclease with TOPRIM domain